MPTDLWKLELIICARGKEVSESLEAVIYSDLGVNFPHLALACDQLKRSQRLGYLNSSYALVQVQPAGFYKTAAAITWLKNSGRLLAREALLECAGYLSFILDDPSVDFRVLDSEPDGHTHLYRGEDYIGYQSGVLFDQNTQIREFLGLDKSKHISTVIKARFAQNALVSREVGEVLKEFHCSEHLRGILTGYDDSFRRDSLRIDDLLKERESMLMDEISFRWREHMYDHASDAVTAFAYGLMGVDSLSKEEATFIGRSTCKTSPMFRFR